MGVLGAVNTLFSVIWTIAACAECMLAARLKAVARASPTVLKECL